MHSLLGWVHPGFSVFAGEAISSEQQLERVARYIARPTLAIDSLRRRQDGLLEIQTPPGPRTGATVRISEFLTDKTPLRTTPKPPRVPTSPTGTLGCRISLAPAMPSG